MRKRPLLGMVLMLAVGWSASVQADVKPVDEKNDKPAESRRRGPRKERSGKPAPKVGEAAPLFKLKMLDSEKVVDLKSISKNKPVLLFLEKPQCPLGPSGMAGRLGRTCRRSLSFYPLSGPVRESCPHIT